MNLISIIRIVVFCIGTTILLYISKNALHSLKVHGFYRFFVFEASLLLILVNFPFWFLHPFSPAQILSWVFLLVSLYYLIQSTYFLRKSGGSKSRENNSTNYQFENTVNLVQEGIYKYIRHPMYSSLLFLNLGVLFKNISFFTIILAATAISFLILTAKVEEKENINFFGDSYKLYMKKTRMFIPFVF